jgi:hypothetical protein
MSYGLMVYAVDFKTLTDVCGQGDESLFQEIWRYFSEEIDRFNEAFDLQSLPGNVGSTGSPVVSTRYGSSRI